MPVDDLDRACRCWCICRHRDDEVRVPSILGIWKFNQNYVYNPPLLQYGQFQQNIPIRQHKVSFVTSNSEMISTFAMAEYYLTPLYNWPCFYRTRFTNGFSIANHIWWQFRFAPTSILTKRSLQNFTHVTRAGLSWHVQNDDAIFWPIIQSQQGEISIEFELRAKHL